MKRRLVHFIMRWPAAYRFVSRIYWTLKFQHLKELLLGTKVRERWWADRSIAEGCWNNRDHASKHYLVQKIASFSPFYSILEVGCASGPNLYLLAKRFPQAQIVGIDINPRAIQYGEAQFAQEGLSNVRLLVGKADELGQFRDRSFDIVFTNALLIYIGPDKIKKVLQQMLRITRRALVLMECHCFGYHKDPYGSGFYYGGNWLRDYAALLKQFVPQGRIRISKIPEEVWPVQPWKEFGAIVEVIL